MRILSISRHTHTYTTYNNIRTRATYTQQTIKSPKHGGLAAKGNNKQQALAATQAIERMSKIKMHCFTQWLACNRRLLDVSIYCINISITLKIWEDSGPACHVIKFPPCWLHVQEKCTNNCSICFSSKKTVVSRMFTTPLQDFTIFYCLA